MAYSIVVEPDALVELSELPSNEARRIVDEIERQLSKEPATETRRRKQLVGVEPPWDQAGPVWQLRIGDHRVFYDVDLRGRSVLVKAIRHKGRKRTGEIL
jgi:mRNA-degrading endonuclease RelE of RelBE toxin-antitoxin system